MTVIGKTEVLGGTFDVDVSNSGMFVLIDDDGEQYGYDPTLEGAKGKTRVAMQKRRVSVNVPFIVVEREGRDGRYQTVRGALRFRRGVARGFDGRRGHGDLLVTFDDGEKGSLSYSAWTFPPDTDEAVLTEFIRQTQLAAEAKESAEAIRRDHALSLGSAVRTAIDAAVAAAA